MGKTIAISVGLSTLAAMFSVNPPHKVDDSPLTSRDDVATSGGPSRGIETLKGVFACCSQVRICVSPRKLDMLIGINRAPSKANNATRERKIEGTVGVCRRQRV
jgi:hypothetical protein